MIKVWLDADSCPEAVRLVILRACGREHLPCAFVANRTIPIPKGFKAEMIVVSALDGAADDYLAESIRPGDLAVTRDIPLAARLLDRGAVVLNDRGEQFTKENIKERLSVRDFMYELRLSGMAGEEDRRFGPREVQKFANTFDRELRKCIKAASGNPH